MNTGKVFELAIKKSCESVEDLYYYRLKDSGSAFNPSADTGLRFTPSNDYDAFFFVKPYFYPIELKSSKQTSFSFQTEKGQTGKNIKLSQIKGLTKASEVKGIFAGFLFNFSEKKKTYWMNVINFNNFLNNTTKKSINEKDMIEYGSILVEQTLKKVNYSYNIKKLIADILN